MSDTQLICEGRCNPHVHEIDAAVRAFRACERRALVNGPLEPVSDDLAQRLRTLRHTRHTSVGRAAAICLICGHARRYGDPALEAVRPAFTTATEAAYL